MHSPSQPRPHHPRLIGPLTQRAFGRFGLSCLVVGGLLLVVSALGSAGGAQPTWSSAQDIASPNPVDSVSCASTTFCVAGDGNGNVYQFNGSSWSSADDIGDTDEILSMSCPTASFCAAGDDFGNVYTFDGTSWSAADDIGGTDDMLSMSCVSADFCVVGDDSGNVYTFDGSSWSGADDIGGTDEMYSVSCVSTDFCAAGDDSGNVYTFDGSSWSAADDIAGSDEVFSMSCPTADFCVAGDDVGNVYLYSTSSTTTTTTTTLPGSTGSSPYELYCPGTPVGDIALNDVVTTGTITPASPAPGSTFNLTNYQTTVAIPASLVSAAAALGNTAIQGSAVETVDAVGATPASLAGPSLSFNVPIPSSVPSSGLQLQLPSPATSIGPFTASSQTVTLSQDSSASLTLVVSGAPLTLTCTAYANDSVPTGITTSAPSGEPISPLIATTGTTTTTTTTTSPSSSTTTSTTRASSSTTSTTAVHTASTSSSVPSVSSGQLAFTGSGPGLRWLAAVGAVLVLGGAAILMAVDAPRVLFRRRG